MSDAPLLELENCEIVYDHHFLAVQGVSLKAHEGDIITLIGPNGAGKSTILKMISGVGKLERGEVTRGSIWYDGDDVTNADTPEMTERGVTHILEGRRVFEDLTVGENLRCGLYRNGQLFKYDEADYELAFEYFPQLKERLNAKAGYISGGEQQMLVIARSLLHQPRLLLLDEPSLGLAPQLVSEIFDTIHEINENEDVTMIVADQNAKRMLDLADYGYVIEGGQVKLHDTTAELKEKEEIKEFFIGQEGNQDRYTDIKDYRITKKWV